MLRKILPLSAAVFGLAMLPNSAQSATATASASAEVLSPIVLTKTVDMSFGDLYADNAAIGTVTLGTDSTRTAGGAVSLGPTAGAAATFTVSGSASATYAITLPSADVTLTSGGNTMVVNTFAHNAGATPALDGTGNDSFNVGAVLNVGISQAAGVYNGSFDVIANYN